MPPPRLPFPTRWPVRSPNCYKSIQINSEQVTLPSEKQGSLLPCFRGPNCSELEWFSAIRSFPDPNCTLLVVTSFSWGRGGGGSYRQANKWGGRKHLITIFSAKTALLHLLPIKASENLGVLHPIRLHLCVSSHGSFPSSNNCCRQWKGWVHRQRQSSSIGGDWNSPPHTHTF